MQNQTHFPTAFRRLGSEALAFPSAPQPPPWPDWSYQTATANTFLTQPRGYPLPLSYRPRFAHPHIPHPASAPTMAAAVDQYNFHTPGIEQAGIGTDALSFGSYPGSDFMDKSWAMGDTAMADSFGFDPDSDQRYSVDPYQSHQRPPSLSPLGLDEHVVSDHRIPQLQPINTSMKRLRDWGNLTPPDDDPSPGAKFPSPEQDSSVAVKEEPSEEPQISPSRRKRLSGGGASQAGSKRRRARKSVASASPDDDEHDDCEPVEDEKRNKFLERNRVAASKCRQKKKEWTVNLETKARELQASKASLAALAASLKEEVMWLKGEMLKHSDCGCTHIREYLAREAQTIASGGIKRSSSPVGDNQFSPVDEDMAGPFHVDWRQSPHDSVPTTHSGEPILSQADSRFTHRLSDDRSEGTGGYDAVGP